MNCQKLNKTSTVPNKGHGPQIILGAGPEVASLLVKMGSLFLMGLL